MNKITKHIIFPFLVTAAFFVVASLPVDLLGCRNRGLFAVCIALAAGMLGGFASGRALLGRVQGEKDSFLWVASALILALPAAYIVLF